MRKAKVVLILPEKSQDVFLWEVIHCPFCGETHFHGTGKDRKTVEQYLSSRVSHCVPGESYSLQWNGKVSKFMAKDILL